MLMDTHCHLYAQEFDADIDAVLERCRESEVQKIFLPSIDSETHERQHRLCQRSTADCELLPMMGLHPCSVKENVAEELALVKNYLNSGTKYYAIGEIGLDYYWDLSFKEKQIAAFEKQIEWAIEKNLPIAIHSRQSTADCIASIRKFEGKAKGVFHCFGGTAAEAREIMEMGFYLGIGGVVTYKKTDLRETIAEVGGSRIVLETDSPYLPPVPYRGKRNEPSYTKLIAEEVARALNLNMAEVAALTSANAMALFQLNN